MQMPWRLGTALRRLKERQMSDENQAASKIR
jgi:hypothetical protein